MDNFSHLVLSDTMICLVLGSSSEESSRKELVEEREWQVSEEGKSEKRKRERETRLSIVRVQWKGTGKELRRMRIGV